MSVPTSTSVALVPTVLPLVTEVVETTVKTFATAPIVTSAGMLKAPLTWPAQGRLNKNKVSVNINPSINGWPIKWRWPTNFTTFGLGLKIDEDGLAKTGKSVERDLLGKVVVDKTSWALNCALPWHEVDEGDADAVAERKEYYMGKIRHWPVEDPRWATDPNAQLGAQFNALVALEEAAAAAACAHPGWYGVAVGEPVPAYYTPEYMLKEGKVAPILIYSGKRADKATVKTRDGKFPPYIILNVAAILKPGSAKSEGAFVIEPSFNWEQPDPDLGLWSCSEKSLSTDRAMVALAKGKRFQVFVAVESNLVGQDPKRMYVKLVASAFNIAKQPESRQRTLPASIWSSEPDPYGETSNRITGGGQEAAEAVALALENCPDVAPEDAEDMAALEAVEVEIAENKRTQVAATKRVLAQVNTDVGEYDGPSSAGPGAAKKARTG